MSLELCNEEGPLGQFASHGGYSDLIRATKEDETLAAFFRDAYTENIEPVETALNAIKSPKDVASTAHGLAALMHGEKMVFITNGTYDGEDEGVKKRDQKVDIELRGDIVKADRYRKQVFGWASIVTIAGQDICDTQGDIIAPDVIENSAYDFVLYARTAGEMHEKKGENVRPVGRVIESCVFTLEKQASMLQSLHDQGISDAQLDLHCVGWWIGFFIEDDATWQKVISGELKAFSIGGRGKRDPFV